MNKIYLSGNYIILELASGDIHELAANVTDYKYKGNDPADFFEVRERGLVVTQITSVELLAGDWENDSAVAYTLATVTDFLRVNTGFNPVPGGSGAPSMNLLTTFKGVNPSTWNEISNNLCVGITSFVRTALGNYLLTFDGNLPDAAKIIAFVNAQVSGVLIPNVYSVNSIAFIHYDFTGAKTDFTDADVSIKIESHG